MQMPFKVAKLEPIEAYEYQITTMSTSSQGQGVQRNIEGQMSPLIPFLSQRNIRKATS